jgi:hypothetical protein
MHHQGEEQDLDHRQKQRGRLSVISKLKAMEKASAKQRRARLLN